MSSRLSGLNPLSYLGVRNTNPPGIYTDTRAPTTGDIQNFVLGDIWIHQPVDDVYMLVEKTGGTATWTYLGGASDTLETLTVPGGTVISPTAHNITFANGTNMSITGTGSTITFNASGGGIDTWSIITDATKTIEVRNGYFANRGGGVTFTLPTTAAIGDAFTVNTINAGGFTVAQNAGQTIQVGNQVSTTGVGGSIASTANGNTVTMVCSVANTSFVVINGWGNITVT